MSGLALDKGRRVEGHCRGTEGPDKHGDLPTGPVVIGYAGTVAGDYGRLWVNSSLGYLWFWLLTDGLRPPVLRIVMVPERGESISLPPEADEGHIYCQSQYPEIGLIGFPPL